MKLFKESFFTLQLFAWIFFIGSGLLALGEIATGIPEFGFDPLWDTLSVIWSLAYILAGLYFVFNIKKLLPGHRKAVICALTGFFILDTLYTCVTLLMLILKPELIAPELVTDPIAPISLIASGIGLWLFSLLIYLVIRRAINTVSGMPQEKPSTWMTIVGWIVVGLILIGLAFVMMAGNTPVL